MMFTPACWFIYKPFKELLWWLLRAAGNSTLICVNRQTFEAFLSKCFGSEDQSFSGYSTRDLLHVIDLNFFVSGNKECRLAFVATMGSVLQSPCTCHGLDHPNLYRCNVLQQAIHKRSYFSKYLRTVNICYSQKYLFSVLTVDWHQQCWPPLRYLGQRETWKLKRLIPYTQNMQKCILYWCNYVQHVHAWFRRDYSIIV